MEDGHNSRSSGDSIAKGDKNPRMSVREKLGFVPKINWAKLLIAEGDEKSVITVVIRPFLDPQFTLEGCKFRPSDTFADIRTALVNQISSDHPLYRFNDPKTDYFLLPGQCFPLEDDWTIASAFKTSCPTTIPLCLYPPIAVPQLPRPETRPPDLPVSDPADDFFTRRPRTETLPFCAASSSQSIFDGPLQIKTSSGCALPFEALEYCTSLHTSASHVLLTPSARLWGILSALNANDDYLVIHISWDRLSFLLPRFIKVFYPDIPFVAVTDLIPHQLDLLTFLNADPNNVNYLYGWDLVDEALELGVVDTRPLNIKWLALRPSDLDSFPAHVFDRLALSRPHDFDNVLSKILWNPHFKANQAWVRELKLFQAYQKCVMFQPVGPLKNLIPNRLRDMDYY